MEESGSKQNVTQLLTLVNGGDSRSAEELLPLVYNELRRLARSRMANEAPARPSNPPHSSTKPASASSSAATT